MGGCEARIAPAIVLTDAEAAGPMHPILIESTLPTPRGRPARLAWPLLAAAALLALPLAGVAGVAAPSTCKPVDPQPESMRKFHPGHYVTIGPGELRKGASVASALGEGVAGVQLRYRWNDLEPAQDGYTLQPIERDLAAASRAGLQLIAVIVDKSFSGESPMPEYLQSGHTMRAKRGYTAVRWDPYVVERMGKLVARIGEAFDCHPNFEGIAFQETALSVEDDELREHGYSPEKYRDSLEQLLRSSVRSLPRSRVFWYMNFLPGKQEYLAAVAERVSGSGVVMGGPDILPDNQALVRRTYPLYERFSQRMKLFGSMQNDSYRHPRAARGRGDDDYWSMEELFFFARDRLHVDYVFWEYRGKRRPADVRDWAEARDVIARHPDFGRSG